MNKCIQFLYMLLIFAGLGHFTTCVGREAFKIVIGKFLNFFLLCLGVWTQEMYDTLGVQTLLDKTSIVHKKPRRYMDKQTYINYRAGRHSPLNPKALLYYMDGHSNAGEGDDQ